jgi:hypothetical protein
MTAVKQLFHLAKNNALRLGSPWDSVGPTKGLNFSAEEVSSLKVYHHQTSRLMPLRAPTSSLEETDECGAFPA